jgi:hypothetical protein
MSAGDSAFIVTDGASWFTIGLGAAVNNNFNPVSINVGGLSGTYVLPANQYGKTAYTFFGALAGNLQIVVPASSYQYWVDNQTSGGFTLTIGISGQPSPPSIAAGARNIYYYNPFEAVIIPINTTGVSLPLVVASGGTGATTLTGPLKGNGTLAFSAAGYADIVGLWTACSSGYLKFDGSCATPGGTGTVTVVSSGSLTSTALVTGGGTTTLQTPAATATMDASGNISTPGSITTGAGGSTAGVIELGQGTAPTAGTTSVKLYAPASVTSYIMNLPGSASTGYLYGTNSAGVVTLICGLIPL